MEKIPIYEFSIPEYNFKKGKPNFDHISSKIVECLREHYMGKRIALRFLGSKEHKGKSVDELIKTIKHVGHDRYNLKRIGDRYENIGKSKIDLFALEFEVGKSREEECIKWALDSFYEYSLKDVGHPVQIDIGIIYDLSKLKVVEHKYVGREDEVKRDGFVFEDQDNKSEAILGILKMIV